MARNLGRYAAPIALVAVIVTTVVVVRAGLATTPHSAPAHHADRSAVTLHAPPRKVFYVIQAGDTLSKISVQTGVSIPTLEALNRSVDPNALQTGQRLRLRR
jgi:nucleoid-associated protein YgaU